jgi:hypothetical protein
MIVAGSSSLAGKPGSARLRLARLPAGFPGRVESGPSISRHQCASQPIEKNPLISGNAFQVGRLSQAIRRRKRWMELF